MGGAPTLEKSNSLRRELSKSRMKRLNIVGPQVRRIRNSLAWSQADLAIKLQCAGWDISRVGVAKIEMQRRRVRDVNLTQLAQVLGVGVVALF